MAEEAPMLSPEAVQVLRDLNPWWADPRAVRPPPPKYRRPVVVELLRRLQRPKGLIEVLRGPRQVGKTTGMQQIVQDLIAAGTPPARLLFVRFDLELLREEPAALRGILAWYASEIRRRPLEQGPPAYVFLDEVHKLRRWHEEVKHVGDTFPVRMLLTGSSSVLVARGGRESLAGRVFTTGARAWPAACSRRSCPPSRSGKCSSVGGRAWPAPCRPRCVSPRRSIRSLRPRTRRSTA